jgi:hypothetical protein
VEHSTSAELGLTVHILNHFMKGIFKIDETKGFKFGTYAFAVACEQDKCTVSEILKRIGIPYEIVDGDGNRVRKVDPVNIMSLLHVFYGAAVSYAQSQKHKADFQTSDVSDWMDELGLEKVDEILAEGLNQYAPKNSYSLAETREAISQ